jgi:hypothetical protein
MGKSKLSLSEQAKEDYIRSYERLQRRVEFLLKRAEVLESLTLDRFMQACENETLTVFEQTKLYQTIAQESRLTISTIQKYRETIASFNEPEVDETPKLPEIPEVNRASRKTAEQLLVALAKRSAEDTE